MKKDKIKTYIIFSPFMIKILISPKILPQSYSMWLFFLNILKCFSWILKFQKADPEHKIGNYIKCKCTLIQGSSRQISLIRGHFLEKLSCQNFRKNFIIPEIQIRGNKAETQRISSHKSLIIKRILTFLIETSFFY